MLRPAALLQFVFNQPVLRRPVRHAQQRFGQHHQRQPLAGRQAIFAQEILDAADAARLRPDGIDIV